MFRQIIAIVIPKEGLTDTSPARSSFGYDIDTNCKIKSARTTEYNSVISVYSVIPKEGLAGLMSLFGITIKACSDVMQFRCVA